MIGVGFYGNNMYLNPLYDVRPVSRVDGVDRVEGGNPSDRVQGNREVEKTKECTTCKNRKYQDGSNEGDVSFKAPGHIDPANSASMVMSHEMEHVANARQETAAPNKQLVSATVSMKIGVCPECGRTFVAGGETNTTIKTVSYADDNPYEKARKTIEGSFYAGNNVDISA